ncbi:MAG: UDP-glucose 4-epimerase GalE [Pseudohongiellaceae bacterium]
MTETILLTGGAGYVGSHTCIAVAEAGYRPLLLDDFSNAKRDVPQRLEQIMGQPVELVEGSVLDGAVLAQIFRQHKISAVIHFAGLKAVGESVDIPLDYFHTNIGGMMSLLNAMRRAEVFRLVFSSSCTVYGNPETLPVTEDAPRSYTNPYGYTKLTCEQMMEQLAQADPRWQFGILRYFNPVGTHESGLIGEDPTGTPTNLMPLMAKVATGSLNKLSVFGNDYDTPDGTAIRDYIHVSDLAEGHVQCLAAESLAAPRSPLAVNLGTGTGYSVLDMIAAYAKACGKELPYEITDRRAGDVPVTYADASAAKRLLGFNARRGLDEMCESSWRWINSPAAGL